MAFLNGMRDGNSGVTAGLLTAKAQEETIKHNWPVQPPGAPTATYTLGDPLYLDQQQTAVQVPCIWAETGPSNEKIEFQVVWVLRQQNDGWRVAGFASEVVPGQQPYFFNFEDIANLKAAQAQAEAALAAMMEPQGQEPPAESGQPGQPAVAEQPHPGTTIR